MTCAVQDTCPSYCWIVRWIVRWTSFARISFSPFSSYSSVSTVSFTSPFGRPLILAYTQTLFPSRMISLVSYLNSGASDVMMYFHLATKLSRLLGASSSWTAVISEWRKVSPFSTFSSLHHHMLRNSMVGALRSL